MYRLRILFAALSIVTLSDPGTLLVDTYGKLLLVGLDGTQRVLIDSALNATLSPDGKNIAFTHAEDPSAFPNTSQILSVVSATGGAARRITQLPRGAHFGSISWLPDGSGIVFEGRDSHLFLVPISVNATALRDLGPWYQGFSISADGSKVVHAVNSPAMGLEVLDIRSGQRTLIHRTTKVVWSAKFSPDGEWIAYQITLHDPPKPDRPDDADCTPPTIGLRLYSMRTKTDVAVRLTAVREWDNVKSFAWSPDSKRLALTLGTTDCDYPGSSNGVFMTTVDLKSQSKISTGDMSLEPLFSPDSASVAYVDFSDSPAKLMRYEIATGSRTLIRRATAADNYYRLIEWK